MSSQVPGSARLTKSLFLRGRQCPLRLWFHGQEVAEPDIESADVWAMRESEGAAVEEIAAQRLQDPVRITEGLDGDAVNGCTNSFDDRISKTGEALTHAPAILQAHLADGPLVAVVDILQRREGGWFLWEVKASTSLKPIFDWDLTFQVLVARRAGLTIVGSGIIHLNRDYERTDDAIDPDAILVEEDRTIKIEDLMRRAELEVEAQFAHPASEERPDTRPSSHCKANLGAKNGDRPSACGHLHRTGECGRLLPEHWAGRLPRLRGTKATHVRLMPDPDMRLLDPEDPDLDWTSDQARAIRAAIEGAPQIDILGLRQRLAALRWPVSYMDFEFDPGMGVPRFPGCRPYDRLPFQWSVLIQRDAEDDLEIPEPFLFDGPGDPRRAFLVSLLDVLPAEGSIVVHQKSAEATVLTQLADRLGGELAEQARALIRRLYDTKELLQAGYYHPDQQCSYSIKKVAGPMLGHAYDDLTVQDGMAAVVGWKELVAAQTDEAREGLRADLLAYCGRDTRLMHEIVQTAQRIVSGS